MAARKRCPPRPVRRPSRPFWLRRLGLADVVVDAHAIVTGLKRGNRPEAPAIGFIAHLDTVDVGLSPFIHPQILRFDGKDLCLNAEEDIWLHRRASGDRPLAG